MNIKTTIRKILFITVWLCIGGGMISLLLASISKKNKGLCKDYAIDISGAANNFFIDHKDVEQLLMHAAKGSLRDRPVASFNLHALEQMLERSIWIEDAELYFDNQDVLHVTVLEKEPVARVFTTAGSSFYIDSIGRSLPLSEKLSARVPVFTNFPDKKRLSSKDSILLNDVRVTANFIVNDSFWMAQVAQIDITTDRKLEMVPVIGNHLVKLGSSENIAQKFNRLMVFYRQVLSKTGFDKYKVIDVQYKGQVLAFNDAGGVAKVDTAQLRRNVEKLLKRERDAQNDTMVTAIRVSGRYSIDVDTVSAPETDLPVNKVTEPVKNEKPGLVKPLLPKPKENKDGKQKQTDVKNPKAVMPKKPAEDATGGNN